jgi:hypothetical protein
MSSSRSIAAARNRQTGNTAQKFQPQQQMRPVTSISSQSAFSQNQNVNQNYVGNNTRVNAKQSNNTQEKNTNGLPFSKLTVSDAIGLVTLRLGRVEQFIIDLQEQEGEGELGTKSSIPANTKLVDNSVLNNIINRLDSLEKKESSQIKDDKLIKIEREINNIKIVLESLTNKIELHEKNVNEKFITYENAIVEIENLLTIPIENNDSQVEENNNNYQLETIEEVEENNDLQIKEEIEENNYSENEN